MESKSAASVSPSEIERQKEYSFLVKTVLASRFGERKPLAFVHTFGCQGNVADSERIKGMLAEMGYAFADDPREADLVLFNTCAVREHAQDRVFGNVGALKPIKVENPDMVIALCGCMMQQSHVAERIKKSFSFVNLVFGTHVVHMLPEMMYRVLCGRTRVFELPESDGVIAEGLPVRRDGTYKAWLPIMYGCNNFCSYCVVPYVRGRERSRTADAVLSEARELALSGYKEITLLGQNVNSYGGKGGFPSLLRGINALDGDFLIRFMTSHPKDCTRELLDTMASCKKVAHHLHLPFQSGNNRVLREMNRGYTAEKYLELIDYAREVMPDISITSDVIVGFPGETYDEFRDTLELVKRVGFTSLFTFIFSPREGTRAASMPDPVSREEKGRWFKELTDLQEDIAAERSAQLVGNEYRVLCEGESRPGSGMLTGRTSGGFVIEFPGDESLEGTYCRVRVTQAKNWILIGEKTIE